MAYFETFGNRETGSHGFVVMKVIMKKLVAVVRELKTYRGVIRATMGNAVRVLAWVA